MKKAIHVKWSVRIRSCLKSTSSGILRGITVLLPLPAGIRLWSTAEVYAPLRHVDEEVAALAGAGSGFLRP
jgi:hypothetical protein